MMQQLVREQRLVDGARIERLERIGARMFGVSECSVAWLDPRCFGLDDESAPPPSSATLTALVQASLWQDLFVADETRIGTPIPVASQELEPKVGFFAGAPLRQQGVPVGVLYLRDESPRSFSDDDCASFVDLAHTVESELRAIYAEQQISTTMRALDEARREARSDALTGLPNRRAAEELLLQRAASATQMGTTFLVALADLDHFKQINDILGHAAGDAALRIAAERMTRCARKGDVVARLGGDEFLFVAAVTSGYGAERMLARVAASVAEPIPAIIPPAPPLGLTAGAVLYRPDESIEGVLQRADEMLYEAKRRGRGNFLVDAEGVAEVFPKRTPVNQA